MYKRIASSSKTGDSLVFSKPPRVTGAPLLQALLDRGDYCFTLALCMVLKNCFAEMPPHLNRNIGILMRKVTAIQEAHAFRPDNYPYLTDEYLLYFGLEEKRKVLNLQKLELKLVDFNAMICVQIAAGSETRIHQLSLLYQSGKYIVFDPNCKTLTPQGYAKVEAVTDILENFFKDNKPQSGTMIVEKVWYTAAVLPTPEVQSETSQKTPEQKSVNKQNKSWSWFSFS